MPTQSTKLKLPIPLGNEFHNRAAMVNLINEIDSKAGEPGGLALLDDSGKVIGVPDVKDASTTQKGIVQLDDSTDSTSITKAATANAVKKAIDYLISLRGKINGFVGLDGTGKATITKNTKLTATKYNEGHMELQTNNQTEVVLGFHALGLTAASIKHKPGQEGFDLETSTGMLAPLRAGDIFSNGIKIESSGVKIIAGSYTGDQTNNRMIGLPFTPKLVIVYQTGGAVQWNSVPAGGFTLGTLKGFVKIGGDSTGPGAGTGKQGITTNGFLISARIYPPTGPQDGYVDTGNNTTGNVYEYIAIG